MDMPDHNKPLISMVIGTIVSLFGLFSIDRAEMHRHPLFHLGLAIIGTGFMCIFVYFLIAIVFGAKK